MKGSCYDSPRLAVCSQRPRGRKWQGLSCGRRFLTRRALTSAGLIGSFFSAVPPGVTGSVYRGHWCLHSVYAPSRNFPLYGEMD